MNFQMCFEMIKKDFPMLDFKLNKITDESLVFYTTFNVKKVYESEIFLNVIVYDNGEVYLFYVFNDVPATNKNYTLVNQFNQKLPPVKAYLDTDDGSLVIVYHSDNLNNDREVRQFMEQSILMFPGELTAKYLKPIVG